jgi:hypothetical protein
MAVDGLTTVQSAYGPKDTMDRLEAEVKAKGLTVFARIDHAAGAAEVGLQLRPTAVLVFGNAKRRHAANAGCPDGRNRSALKGARLARCRRQGLVIV